MAEFTAEQRAALLALAQDIAESEHRLRHRSAFELVCATVGFTIEYGAARTTVIDPPPELPEPEGGE